MQIQSMHNHECLQRPSNGPNPTGKVITTKCALDIYGPQGFVIPVVNKPCFIMTDESVCLDVNSADEHSPVLWIACSEFDRQKWTIHPKTNFIVHQKSKLCLTLGKRGSSLLLIKCRPDHNRQRWNIRDNQWSP